MAVGGYMSGIFGGSPVSPLQKHMSKVYACARELIPLFNAVINEDWDEVAKRQQLISNLEQEADVLKKTLRLNLPKGLFMPVSRQDLLEVLLMQDSIANKAKDIAGTIVGRHMKLPDMRVVGNIFMSWVVTLPVGGLLAILFFFILKGIFS